MRPSVPFYAIGGAGVIAGAFVGLPLFIGLGAADACACEQRLADKIADWKSCAATVVEEKGVRQILPTTRYFVTRDASGEMVDSGWTNPTSTEEFERFLAEEVTPQCGSFADARDADSKMAWWRALYGYEALYIPEDANAVLARDEY